MCVPTLHGREVVVEVVGREWEKNWRRLSFQLRLGLIIFLIDMTSQRKKVVMSIRKSEAKNLLP